MADYGRYGDQTRDRESSSRYGRDRGDERGGWGRDRDEDRSRGSSMFGSGWGDDDSRSRDRNRGWGSDDNRDRDRGWGSDNDRARSRDHDRSWSSDNDRSWGSNDRSWGHDDDRTRSRDSGRHGQERGRGFGSDDRHEGLPIEETSRLIASNKVEGTSVYGHEGNSLGTIYNFMVDKRSGKVEYAVMSYGGFLGMGTRYYPMPWEILTYDTRLGGYRVEMAERDLERAPSFDRSSEPDFDRRYNDRVRGWYNLHPA